MNPVFAAFMGLPHEARAAVLLELSDEERLSVQYAWRDLWARPAQLEPEGNWRTWLIDAGRGFGKTRTGAEWIRERVERTSVRRIHLVGPTAGDVRDVMVEGESGILAVSPPWYMPKYESGKRRLTWPDKRSRGGSIIHGAVATCFSAEEPRRLRGPQCELAWADEVAAWQYDDAWDQLQFGLRLGNDPRCVVTTTPKPVAVVRSILKDPATFVTRGTTYDNSSNLAAAFLDRMKTRYEGTRLGRQELFAELLDDAPGALWKRSNLDLLRIQDMQRIPPFRTIVIGVDPAVADPSRKNQDERGAETGIVTAGVAEDGHAYVIRDDSGHFTPNEWAQRVCKLFEMVKANYVIAEVNQGGALVESNLRTVAPNLPILSVHASRGKYVRAEPVAGLYEQGRVHHLGTLANLEDGMCQWDPMGGVSTPWQDRIDAMVWALTHLLVENGASEPRKLPPPVHLRPLDDVSVF